MSPDASAGQAANEASIGSRYTYRETVIYDTRLSDGAVRLYVALDEYARMTGVCWPQFRTLGLRLGWKRRYLAYRMTELRLAGHIRTERLKYGCRFYLAWADMHGGAPQMCTPVHISPYNKDSQRSKSAVLVFPNKTKAQEDALEILMHPGSISGAELARARRVYNGDRA